ncbi:hypothetical protein NCS57_00146700 [Fusarium keratoplasticum]|uniref:Uncharacterized protein n=1 Tax=Fusarium keratoplasticum TaxID=1328300 RepID=A0ACC0RG01_9HYPO|nr:hypothetical protein NCS57_00146700 [Fusarium keratoplasticum]KAI8684796.1 hypothetical protein NCS57_00146700 [Fusarium keratoplasticum]
MTTTATEARARPAIEPIRTTGPELNTWSFRARMAFKSPAWSASPLSPRSLPLPGCQELRDEQMRQHDKMAVDRLEPRSRDSSKLEPSLRNVSLRPIAELALPSPNTLPARRSPLSAPLFAPPVYRRPTIVEETRNMLLQGQDGEQGGHLSQAYDRRQSAPPGVLHARAMQIARQREHLRRRGFVGSYRPREAELLVMPVELRRLSAITGAEPPSPCPVDGQLTTRVVVHSRGRKPLVLTRTFDLDELRATLPRVSPVDRADQGRRASVATLQTPSTANRLSSPGLVTERRHSHGALPARSPQRSPAAERRSSRQGLSSVAIHLEYARTYLPVLAAIILSEIVRPGDTIELPLPHPRAWEDTVAYIYTGRVALTEPIRQNILYLGGKV